MLKWSKRQKRGLEEDEREVEDKRGEIGRSE